MYMRKKMDYLKKWIREHPNQPMIRCAREPVEGSAGPTIELGELNIAADSLIHVDSSGDAQRVADATSAQILIAQGVNSAPTWNAVSGDVTISSAGAVTIGAAKVTDAMMVNDKVSIAGDTMTGDLTMSGADVLLAGNILNLSAITMQEVSDIVEIVVPDDVGGAGIRIKNTDGSIYIHNGTSTANRFVAVVHLSTSGNSSIKSQLLADVPVAEDTGTTPILILNLRQDDATSITSRDLLHITNDASKRWGIDKDGNVTYVGRLILDKGADVASPVGGIMTLGVDGNTFDITGTNTINEILGTTWTLGAQIVLRFDGALTLTNNSGGTNDLLLSGGVNYTTVAGDYFGFVFDGIDWNEIFRSTLGISTILTDAQILVGNGSNVAVDVAVSGDITMANTGATTIGAGKVTSDMLAGSIALSKLTDAPEANATADQTDAEIETAYNNQVGAMSQATAEAGTSTTIERITAERIKQAIDALGGVLKASAYSAVGSLTDDKVYLHTGINKLLHEQTDANFERATDLVSGLIKHLVEGFTVASQATLDTRWPKTGTDIAPVVANDRIDFSYSGDGADDGCSFDLLQPASNTWVLRGKVILTTITENADGSPTVISIGLSSADHATAGDLNQDGIYLMFRVNNGQGKLIYASESDGTNLREEVQVFAHALAVETIWFEIIRTSDIEATIQLFSDAFVTPIELETIVIPATVTGLQYIFVKNVVADGTEDHVITGSITDVHFKDEVTSF